MYVGMVELKKYRLRRRAVENILQNNAYSIILWKIISDSTHEKLYIHNPGHLLMYSHIYRKNSGMYKKDTKTLSDVQLKYTKYRGRTYSFAMKYVQSDVQSGGTPNPTFFGDNTNKNISNTLECPKIGTFEGSRITLDN